MKCNEKLARDWINSNFDLLDIEYEIAIVSLVELLDKLTDKKLGYAQFTRVMPIAFVTQIDAFIKTKSEQWEKERNAL